MQNWQLATDAVDYFAVAEHSPSPAQHFWSLSVEEQFYLLWPVLLLGRLRAAPRRSSPRMAALTVVSFGYALLKTAANPAAAYFVSPTRAWEFGAGGLLAAWRHCARGRRRCCAGPALTAILAGALAPSDRRPPFPASRRSCRCSARWP